MRPPIMYAHTEDVRDRVNNSLRWLCGWFGWQTPVYYHRFDLYSVPADVVQTVNPILNVPILPAHATFVVRSSYRCSLDAIISPSLCVCVCVCSPKSVYIHSLLVHSRRRVRCAHRPW